MPTYEELISNSVRRPRGYTYEGYPDTEAGAQFVPRIEAVGTNPNYPNLTPRTLYNVAGQESDFNPNLTTGGSGARGIMQFTPGTEQYLERPIGHPRGGRGYPDFDPYDPAQALDAGGHYLSDILKDLVSRATWAWPHRVTTLGLGGCSVPSAGRSRSTSKVSGFLPTLWGNSTRAQIIR